MNGIDQTRYSMLTPTSIMPVVQDADGTYTCENNDSQHILRAKYPTSWCEVRRKAHCKLTPRGKYL